MESALPMMQWNGNSLLALFAQISLRWDWKLTYLVGFSGHGFTKAPGVMKPKTPFPLAQGDEIKNFNMRHFQCRIFCHRKEDVRPKNVKCSRLPWFQTPLQTICWILPSQPGHTKDEGWNYGLAVPHLKLQMKLVDLLRCRLEDRALGKNTFD